jgi:hypothetical protein
MKFDFNDYKSYQEPLSEEFIEQNKDLVDWYWISAFQKLSEEFIERNKDLVNWFDISRYQKLSEEFIERNKDLVNWNLISANQKLSEEFIERNKDLVNWFAISQFQKLSEEFIQRNKDLVNWRYISAFQKLSEEFIEQNKDLVDWEYISKYQKLSEEFRLKHNLSLPKNNWLYSDKETKRKAIKDCGLYELDNDWVIAYKGIRSNGYSKYNFQYKYELGSTYQCHADHNLDNENSFGLSAWTEEKAREYCNEKIVKVRVHLDHVAALVHDCHKIRCEQFEIIEEL